MSGAHERARATTSRRRRRADWAEDFFAAFRETGMVTAAAKAVRVGRSTVYLRREEDEAFAAIWADIEEEVIETMEREAYRRAVDGVEKPLVSAGKLVTTVTEHSDGLLQFLLKARRPNSYRDNVKIEHSGRIAQPVAQDLSKLTDEQLAQLEAINAALEA